MLDFYASERHYADHLAPIWQALHPSQRGIFWSSTRSDPHVQSLGIQARLGRPDRRSEASICVAAWQDMRAALPRPVVFVEHGAGQRYFGSASPSYAGGSDRQGVALYLCPSESVAEANRVAYPQVPCVVVGSPKMANWHRTMPEVAPGTVALAFHWPCKLLPETDWAFGHFKAALPDLAQAVKVIGHGHPRAIRRLTGAYTDAGIEVVEDLSEVFARASLLVVDNSSAGAEFASLGRPVAWLSSPTYRRDVHHGGRFWDWLAGCVHIEHPGDLVDGVRDAIADTDARKAQRQAWVDQTLAYRDGSAAARAVAAIADAGLL